MRVSRNDNQPLPIDALEGAFRRALDEGPVVVSSPTGSGKSTQVPRWCPGPVLVVEPRRVACRSLAQRVADLEGCDLGTRVGYQVRDEQRLDPGGATGILFVTPGIALRRMDDWSSYRTIILDEFHERGLDLDLLLALLMRRYRGRLVVMSATLDGERVARHLGGRHLHAAGRLFDTEVRYVAGKALLPTLDGLDGRLADALAACGRLPGDVLVFLPGKGEIQRCRQAATRVGGFEVLELHGGLSLKEQHRVFAASDQRKIILATNVAETSLTVPGIGVVIDSGLVRQTRYVRDRGFLTLVAVALDSAEQRRGRAGRTSHGVCLRLWSPAAQLEARTAPEVFRESLVPLVLAAAACAERAKDLPFFDPPKPHALETAEEELKRLGALDDAGALLPAGRQLFDLPLDVASSRLLVEAQNLDGGDGELLDDMIDLVAALGEGRSLLRTALPEDDEDAMIGACDAVALIRALRQPERFAAHLQPQVLAEARRTRQRLRRYFARSGPGAKGLILDRRRLAGAVMAADARSAYLARRRGRRVCWSNGGTEIDLGRGSAVHRLDDAEALLMLATRAVGLGGRETRVLITQAMPVPVEWIAEAGLGRERVGQAKVVDGVLWAVLERVFARRVLAHREVVPQGAMARQALVDLIVDGRHFPQLRQNLGAELENQRLVSELVRRGLTHEMRSTNDLGDLTDVREWLMDRLARLGFDDGEDLPLLSASDLELAPLPEAMQQEVDRQYPRRWVMPGVVYELEYDLARGEVILRQTAGRRMEVPPLTYLPRLPGLRVRLHHKGNSRLLREASR